MLIQHRKKGFSDYQIFIEDKNKYAHQWIEEGKRKKEYRLYPNFLSLPRHKVGYTVRKLFDKRIWTTFC